MPYEWEDGKVSSFHPRYSASYKIALEPTRLIFVLLLRSNYVYLIVYGIPYFPLLEKGMKLMQCNTQEAYIEGIYNHIYSRYIIELILFIYFFFAEICLNFLFVLFQLIPYWSTEFCLWTEGVDSDRRTKHDRHVKQKTVTQLND